MDLNWSAAQTETRLELRRWLERNLAAWRAEIGVELSGDTLEGFARQLLWERRLYEAGWSAVAWPRAYGGRDGTLWDWLIFEGGVLAGRRPAAGDPERDPDPGAVRLRARHAGPEGPSCCPASRRPRTCGARAGPSPTRAATSPRSPAGPGG